MMMVPIDSQLRILVKTCQATGNYQKLSATILNLISNKVDIIGLKSGLARRNQDKEQIFEYLKRINERCSRYFNLQFFTFEIISDLKTIEILFSKNNGTLPKNYLKRAISIFYEVRQINIPELKISPVTRIHQKKTLGLFSRTPKESPTSSLLKELMLDEIELKEQHSQRILAKGFDEGTFETANRLHQVRRAIEQGNKRKFSIRGKLIEDPRYKSSQANLGIFLLMGIAILFGNFASIMIIESIIYPFLLDSIGYYIFIFFVATIGFSLLTIKKLNDK